MPVAVLTSTLYPSMDRPPVSVGSDQSTTTLELSPFRLVTGAAGFDGTVAAVIVKIAEYSDWPTALRALTLKR